MADDKKFAQTERFSGEVNKCIDCGNCTFWCPVYEVRPRESSVARGKNTLIRALLKGEIEINEELVDALNTCTLCMACTEHCLVDCDVKSAVIAARSDKLWPPQSAPRRLAAMTVGPGVGSGLEKRRVGLLGLPLRFGGETVAQ